MNGFIRTLNFKLSLMRVLCWAFTREGHDQIWVLPSSFSLGCEEEIYCRTEGVQAKLEAEMQSGGLHNPLGKRQKVYRGGARGKFSMWNQIRLD